MAYDEGRIAADATRPQGAEPVPTGDSEAESGRAAAQATSVKRHPAARVDREIVETLLLAVVIFLAVRLVVLNFRVDGESMVPNLDDAQMLLVNRNAYLHFDLNGLLNPLPGEDREGERIVYPFDPPERGDIVVFEPPVSSDKPYIKRVIGLPGETISFHRGEVYVNDEPLDEPYIDDGITRCERDENCNVTVPGGEVYVLGDNRENSSDSRVFGPVSVDQIIGKAWFSYWPIDDLGLVPHYDYPDVPEGPVAAGEAGPDGAPETAASPEATDRVDRPGRTARTERTPRPDRGARSASTPTAVR